MDLLKNENNLVAVYHVGGADVEIILGLKITESVVNLEAILKGFCFQIFENRKNDFSIKKNFIFVAVIFFFGGKA
ncbi:MAG: hypothetical protein B7Y39_07630 [Bdellovibrio sp. 28-41-41]|nr:MAG: hypothetical protein B7Y39_07630 [Bdellovibrio sp. 28-41-41]